MFRITATVSLSASAGMKNGTRTFIEMKWPGSFNLSFKVDAVLV